MRRAWNSIMVGSLALVAACGTQQPAPEPAATAVSRPKPAATAPGPSSLSNSAYKVEWGEFTVPSMGAGKTALAHLGLKNASPVAWPSGVGTTGMLYTVRLTHRWLKVVPNGEPREAVGYLGVRSEVPALQPGESATVEVGLTAPAKRGRYIVEFELLNEGVATFSGMGSTTKRVEVKVGP